MGLSSSLRMTLSVPAVRFMRSRTIRDWILPRFSKSCRRKRNELITHPGKYHAVWPHGPRRLYRLAIGHDLYRGDDRVAPSAHNVTPRIRVFVEAARHVS